MKPKFAVLLVVALLLAMVPALAMAKGQAKPEKIIHFTIDRTQPIQPQIQAALGVNAPAPKPGAPAAAAPRQLPAALGVRPNAVQGLLNESFENPWPDGNWIVWDFSFYDLCWGTTDYVHRRGHMSAWPAAGCADGYDPSGYPYYQDDMETWMDYPMDLSNATKASVRFQFRNDTEFGWDYFIWCASHDGIWFDCDAHTGSTNGTWRLVKINLANFYGENYLGDSDFLFTWGFLSDSSFSGYGGAYVDAIRIRATGP
ncbi:MAG: hypothetical protein KIT52_09290 [Anaerolineae bacterium]|nr:hypothetical protein [Anaerolineae bacterium]